MREPTAAGGGVSHWTDAMFLYQAVALAGSAAYAATSARGRAISISVTTSTATREFSHRGSSAQPPVRARIGHPEAERVEVAVGGSVMTRRGRFDVGDE